MTKEFRWAKIRTVAKYGKLLSTPEAADYLGVCQHSIFRYIQSGRLRAFKIGEWRTKQSDLEKFLDKHSNVKRK